MQEGILDYAYAVPHVGLPPHAGGDSGLRVSIGITR